MPARLERSTTNRMIAGVCGGIAEYLAVDATWIRLFFAVATFFGGLGLLAYIFLVIVMPQPGQRAPFVRSSNAAGSDAAASGDAASESGSAGSSSALAPVDTARRREVAGYLLIAFGVIFLLANQGAFRFLDWRLIWPLALVAVGALLIVQRSRQ